MIDAGVGNLGNLERALRRVGAAVEVTDDPAAGRPRALPAAARRRRVRAAARGPAREAGGGAPRGPGRGRLAARHLRRLPAPVRGGRGVRRHRRPRPAPGPGDAPARDRAAAAYRLEPAPRRGRPPAARRARARALGLLRPQLRARGGARRAAARRRHPRPRLPGGRRPRPGAGDPVPPRAQRRRRPRPAAQLPGDGWLEVGGCMELLPAIDLRRGRAVRLVRGDDAQRHRLRRRSRGRAGALCRGRRRPLHVVDLDAAFGEPPQRELDRAVWRPPGAR